MGPLGAQTNLVASWLHRVSFAQQEGVQMGNSPPLLTQPAHWGTSLTFSLPLVSGLAFWGAWASTSAGSRPTTHTIISQLRSKGACYPPTPRVWLAEHLSSQHCPLRLRWGLQAPPGRQRGILLNKALRG